MAEPETLTPAEPEALLDVPFRAAALGVTPVDLPRRKNLGLLAEAAFS